MTPYEAQSLELARSALTIALFSDIIMAATLLTALVGSIFAYLTIKNILKQLQATQWSTLLSLEQEMRTRSERFFDLAKQLATASPPQQHDFDAAKESYFNAIDRLASLILNGQFPQRELKQDYQDLIKETIRAYPADFGAGTRYRKMLKLHEKWEDGN